MKRQRKTNLKDREVLAANVSHYLDTSTYYELVWLLIAALTATVEEGIVSPDLAGKIADEVDAHEKYMRRKQYNN
jgi:hypothetical protein